MPNLEREHPEHARPDILARLEQAVSAIHDSETFRRYLETQARFHRYSFANTLLILLQRPDASQVAGFQAWKRLGRQVRRGEKGIAIVVPHVRKARDEGSEDGEERRVAGFGMGYVFDISQTDGEPLPTVAVPVLEGEEGQALYDRLAGLVARENLILERQPAEVIQDGVMGFYLPTSGRIVVREAAPLQMTKTLAHELGHHFSGRYDTRAESETIAESVAFVVCAHHGLDSATR
jgi:antirestriction protein ArdC